MKDGSLWTWADVLVDAREKLREAQTRARKIRISIKAIERAIERGEAFPVRCEKEQK